MNRLAFTLARRDMSGGLRRFWILLMCLTLGVGAIAGVATVRAAIQTGLVREGANLLGGDAELRLTYRFADADEKAFLAKRAVAVSEIADFRSMIAVGQDASFDSALTQLKAVDAAYPLVGAVGLEPQMDLSVALAGMGGRPGAVIEPVLIDRLGMEVGDVFRLGAKEFVLMAALTHEPDTGSGGFSLGARSIVGLPALEGSGLLAPGTLFETNYRLKLAENADLQTVKNQVKKRFGDAGRWRDKRNGAPGVATFVDRLGAFLVLVGLAGLIVGGVGVASAVRAYLDSKTETIATLKTLGASTGLVFQIYFIQIGALTLMGVLGGLVLWAGVPVLIEPILAARLPLPIDVSIYPSALLEGALYGVLAALIFALWPLARASDVRAAALFRDAAFGVRGWPRWPYLLGVAVLIAALVGAAVWMTDTARLTLWSFAGMGGAFLTLVLMAFVLKRLSGWMSRRRFMRGRLVGRLAFGAVGGPGGETLAVMLSLGLGLAVLSAVGQIDHNLRASIADELPAVAPSYFVLDIQPDQMEGFSGALDGFDAVTKVESAPMLRGIISQINGQPARDVAGDHWVIRGDRGLSYASAMPSGTELVEGTWWGADYVGAPQISFAANEAAEIGLELGDSLTVNVLGRDITGRITSFREVDFSTAGMGFVMVFNEAALADAPHSFIATIYADAGQDGAIMRSLNQSFPNITAVRVRDAIDQVISLVQAIASATTLGAAATLMTGAVVLVGAAAVGERGRRFEGAVLFSLGASRSEILRSFALRGIIVGIGAGVVAILAGATGAWAVLHFVMEAAFSFSVVNSVLVIAIGVGLTLATGQWFSWRALRQSPAQVLRARD